VLATNCSEVTVPRLFPVSGSLPTPSPQLMNKAELVSAVQKSLGKDASRAEADRSVQAVIEAIKLGLKKDQSVQLVGFGTFKVATRKARTGINPSTRAPMKIKASKTVRFTAGKDLKAKVK
jgi:DNA-binding protein HU-beta